MKVNLYHLIFSYLPLVISVVTMFAFVRRAQVRVRIEALWAIVLLFASAKFLCFDAFGGDAFAPELPARLILFWDWAYSGAMILAALAVVTYFVPLKSRVRLISLPLVAWSLAGLGLWNGLSFPRVREVEICSPSVTAELDGYRIVQLSDLHVSSAMRRARTAEVVARVNALAGDLIVVTGDLVDGRPAARKNDLAPIRGLKASDGVYFVSGNHEFYGEWTAWQQIYADWNLRFLRNDCVAVRPDLVIGGLDDQVLMGCPESVFYPQPAVESVFATAPQGAFRVLLQHRPTEARQNLEKTFFHLQLSGHTHGGVMPGMATLVSWHNAGFVRGLYTLADDSRLYVSTGTGQWAGFPMRFFDDPEITVITLRKK